MQVIEYTSGLVIHRDLSQYTENLSRFKDFYYKDQTVSRSPYIYNGNSYTGMTTTFYIKTDPWQHEYGAFEWNKFIVFLFMEIKLQTSISKTIINLGLCYWNHNK